MFGRRRKKDHSTLNFKTNNYEMNDSYDTSNLVVGNLEYVSSKYTDFGPMVEKTKQKYIFEKIIEEDKTRYREIFTGFVVDRESAYFDLPYVVDIVPLKERISNVAERVPKYGFLLLIDEINRAVKVKVHKKQ